MQTFLPYASFQESAEVLDMRRLGKQRVEGVTLLQQLIKGEGKWLNHPAALMWRGYELALAVYTLTICEHWRSKGYKDSCAERVIVWVSEIDPTLPIEAIGQHMLLLEDGLPPWIGLPQFHESHKSNLVRKLPEHYRTFWPQVPNDLPYYWPVQEVNA